MSLKEQTNIKKTVFIWKLRKRRTSHRSTSVCEVERNFHEAC